MQTRAKISAKADAKVQQLPETPKLFTTFFLQKRKFSELLTKIKKRKGGTPYYYSRTRKD
jgi:hypothetical protein